MSLPKGQARYYKGGLEGREDRLIWQQFSDELVKARRAAGHKIGAEIKKKQRAAVRAKLIANGIDPDRRLNHRNEDDKALVAKKRRLSKGSGAYHRRLAGIRYVVGRKGALVMIDHAPLAEAQEEGKTITATGGLLSIGRAGKGLGKPGTRIPGAFTFRSKKGNLLLMRKTGKGQLEHLATMMRSIRIKKTLGFYERIEAMLPQYMDEIEKNLIEGFK